MSELFNSGQRPAVDSGLSVSRVGSSAQIKAMKQVAGSLKIELANFRELQSFSQFGSDLDQNTKNILNHGEVLMEVLRQPQYVNKDVNQQIIELFTAKNKYLEHIGISNIRPCLDELYSHIQNKHPDILETLANEKVISLKLEEKMKKVISKFITTFENSLKK